MQFAAGRFGLSRTTSSFLLSNGLSLGTGPWRFSATLPIVIQDGGAVQYAGGGMAPTGGMPAHGGSGGMSSSGMMGGGNAESFLGHAGIGDPILRGDVAIAGGDGPRALRLVATAKAPLAGAGSGYGSGEWDVGAGLASSIRTGRTLLFADVVFWAVGKPDSVPLKNSVAYALAAGRPVTADGRIALLVSLVGATALVRGLGAPVGLGIGASYRTHAGRFMNTMMSVGLTPTAPAVSVGIGWRVPIGD